MCLCLNRPASSGRSGLKCTPAPPAATTWAKTMWWSKTRPCRFSWTSSFQATAKADEVQNQYDVLAHLHPSCAPSYTVKYLQLHFEMHCTHIFTFPRARCILHITAIYVYNHSYTNNLSRDLTSSAQLGLSSLTSPAWNSNRGTFFTSPLPPLCHRSWLKTKRTKKWPPTHIPFV